MPWVECADCPHGVKITSPAQCKEELYRRVRRLFFICRMRGKSFDHLEDDWMSCQEFWDYIWANTKVITKEEFLALEI